MSIFKYQLESLERTLVEYKAGLAAHPGHQGYADLVERVELSIANKKRQIAVTKTSITIFKVVEEMPYTNCCDHGRFDREETLFTEKPAAEEFMAAILKEEPRAMVSLDEVELFGAV